MSRWTAIIAVTCSVCASAGGAYAQALEAKASFIFNGQTVTIDRNNSEAARYAASFAAPVGSCGAPCIAPMQAAAGVDTLGETEVLSFLVDKVANSEGLLVDARMPEDRAQGFIPGSVNLPYATMLGETKFRAEILQALGTRALDGVFNFADAQHLLIFDTGPSSDDAGTLITALLEVGYPAEKISYYRGGMQVWSVLGFSIEDMN